MTVGVVGERVARALRAGWTAALDGTVAVAEWKVQRRPSDPGPSRTLEVRAGDRWVQVHVSPAGRSVRVFVDGREVPR